MFSNETPVPPESAEAYYDDPAVCRALHAGLTASLAVTDAPDFAVDSAAGRARAADWWRQRCSG